VSLGVRLNARVPSFLVCVFSALVPKGRMHLDVPILDSKDPELSRRDAPSLGESDDRVVVTAPQARCATVCLLVPGVHRCAHGGMLKVLEGPQYIRIVVARGDKPALRMPEHLRRRNRDCTVYPVPGP
jgi:hypothetical protein